jgi:pimeloyl-ACP methyl ester carboxylesterase
MSKNKNGDRFSTLLGVAAGAAAAAGYVQFLKQKDEAIQRIGAGSSMMDTALGPVEYVDVGDGPVVISAHGILAGYDQALECLRPLVDMGFRVIAPSRPGYLRTPLIKDMSPIGQADFLAALLDALKIDQAAALIGLSGGGPTAIQFAVRHAARLKSLVLMCAVTHRIEPNQPDEHLDLRLLRQGIQSDLQMWLAVQGVLLTLPLAAPMRNDARVHLLADPELMAWYRRVIWGVFPSSIRREGTLIDEGHINTLEDLPLEKINLPTLVAHGTADTLVPYEHATYAAARIPGAKLLTGERGEHAFFVSQKEQVWPEVAGHIRSASGAAASAKAQPAKKPVAKKPVAKKPVAKKAPARPKTTPKRTTQKT